LFDTLVARHTTAELVAVLAHEMGHYRMRHIVKMTAMGIAQTGLMLFLMSRFMQLPALYEAFAVQTPSVHTGLVCFAMLYRPLDAFLTVLGHVISRRHEFAADRFAAATADRWALIAALKKLSLHNLSNLKPHPLYVFLNYSHPPVLQRIAVLQRHGSTTPNGSG
jgi:STE24 endopeptidase